MKAIVVCFLSILVFCAGCSTTVKPTAQSKEVFNTPEFACQPVNVINGQSATEIVKIGSTGTGMGQIPKTVYANLHDWTEIATQILTAELKKKTAANPSAKTKQLTLFVTRVEVTPVTFLGGNSYNIRLKAEMGEGKSREFGSEYTDVKRSGIEEIGGTALTKTISEMLRDEEIRAWLTKVD